MSRPRILRAGAMVLLAAVAATTSGCIHNHYYGTGLPAYTTTDIGPVSIGSVCEVPPTRTVGGTVVSQAPGTAPAVVGSTPAPRVVVSEPARGPKLSWRRSDPEGGLATTRVEGGLDDSVNR